MELNPKFTVTEIELIYRIDRERTPAQSITSSGEAYRAFLEGWDLNRIALVEQFKVLLLNRANRAIGLYENSTGGTSGTIVDIKLVMVAALKANAHGLIVCHNHPSSNLKPSDQDIRLTDKLVAAGRFLDIPVIDHLIVATNGYYSFADEGRF